MKKLKNKLMLNIDQIEKECGEGNNNNIKIQEPSLKKKKKINVEKTVVLNLNLKEIRKVIGSEQIL